MLYDLAPYLTKFWGPFRLLQSQLILLSAGTVLAALLVLFLLPKLWHLLPHDHGKAILGKDGMKSAGKPTGAGFYVTLLVLPVLLLVMPFRRSELGVIVCLYLSMLFGYLDDGSEQPWGELKKGLLDIIVSVGAAACIFLSYARGTGESSVHVWLPFVTNMVSVPWWLYIPGAGFMLWFVMNATNCSDGVDGLAGTLTTITLMTLAGLLLVVIGVPRFASYYTVSQGLWRLFGALIFFALGVYLIVKAIRKKAVFEHRSEITYKKVMGTALITSLDSLLAGISSRFLDAYWLSCLATLFGVTALCAFFGVSVGYHFGYSQKNTTYGIGGALFFLTGVVVLIRLFL